MNALRSMLARFFPRPGGTQRGQKALKAANERMEASLEHLTGLTAQLRHLRRALDRQKPEGKLGK